MPTPAPSADPSGPRLWILSELYYPERVATSYILTRIAEHLAKELVVGVITGPPTSFYIKQEGITRADVNGVTVLRCAGTGFRKDGLLGRIVNGLTRSTSMFLRALLSCRRDDVLLVVTNPPLLPFAAVIVSFLRRTRLVVLVHDVYPEVLVASGLCGVSSPIVRLWGCASKWLFRWSDAVVVLGRDMRDLVLARSCIPSERVTIIPNWAELEYVTPRPKAQSAWLKELGLQNKFIVLYAGTIGRTHGMETVLDTADRLKDHKDIHILIAGFGAQENFVRKEIDQRHLTNVSVHRFTRPREEQGDTLNACDIGLISFKPGMSGVSVPSRMYNLMAAGRPLIGVTDPDSELARVIKEERLGWVVPPGNAQALAEAILSARNAADGLLSMGKAAVNAARNKYTFEAAVAAYASLLKRLTRPPSARIELINPGP